MPRTEVPFTDGRSVSLAKGPAAANCRVQNEFVRGKTTSAVETACRAGAGALVDQLEIFDSTVRSLCRVLETEWDSDSVGRANDDVAYCNRAVYGSLSAWVDEFAPRKPKGFGWLSIALQDAYQATAFLYLAVLGYTTYDDARRANPLAGAVSFDQVVNEREAWLSVSMSLAAQIIRQGAASDVTMTRVFTDRLRKPFKPTRELYEQFRVVAGEA